MSSILRPVNVAALAPFFNVSDIESDPVISTTYLGTPVYSNLTFLDNPQSTVVGDVVFETAIITVNRPKNIVATQIQGRDGDVNEYINAGDYQISVQGRIVSQEQLKAPEDAVVAFREMMNIAGSLEVASFFLEMFDIHTVVVLNYGVSEIIGSRNQYEFFIEMKSENPIELQINAGSQV